MMRQIILNEWKILLRIRVLAYLTIFFIIGLTAVTLLCVEQNNRQREQQRKAKEHVREQWESIDKMNPHIAAHFGSYAYKPVTTLNSIDDGINSITGNVLRLEAHVQNEIAYSEASQSLSISKFGKLKPSLLLQYVIPLFLIFMAFASVSSEKESGRLKLLVFQGASLPKLITAKALSVWIYGLFLLFITIIIQILINLKSIDTDSITRLLLILLAYTVYYYIVAALATYFSAKLKSNVASLSTMLAIWILWTIFIPKIWGNTVDKIYPLPSRQEFKTAMMEDRSKGMDGHNPSDKRTKEFTQKVLNEYNVNSVEELSINFDGLRMQADEDYGNKVWDKHFGNNYKIQQKQKNLYQLSGVLNPFASLQSVGMGFSSSDMLHHLYFLKQAEQYRRNIIKKLNNKQTYGGSKTGDWDWKENNDFYLSIEDFKYNSLRICDIINYYKIDILCLLFWTFITTLLITLTTKNIKFL